MTNKTDLLSSEFVAQTQTPGKVTLVPGQPAMPVWCASLRMALVSAAGLVAAGLMATGISGCADMSGIAPQANLCDAPSLGLTAAADVPEQAQATVAAEW